MYMYDWERAKHQGVCDKLHYRMTSEGQNTVLVTGGAGFIGSNLIEKLVATGKKIYSLDDYSTGSRVNHINGATYIEGATSDIEYLVSFRPDVIYHLGEYARVEQSFNDIERVWTSTKEGTFAVLEFCRKFKSKIVYAASSTKHSDDVSDHSLSPYTWSKATNVELIRNYGDWFGVPHAIAYFYNVYGPCEISEGPYATVIGIFKEQYKRGEPLTVVSPGTQIRNFTHVDDIVRGLIMIGEKGIGDGYGLAAEESYSIQEVATLFGSRVIMLPERRGNRMKSIVDIGRTRSEFGWKAEKKLTREIADYVRLHKRPGTRF
jgi:UDP-glucose 4-epimerase